ncbi:MAG TPA: hypothetical protein VFU21_33575, partial [Kofleriaceae bacterium]|nr:hypothetical protein [Kofleriaceae bacterium]
GTPPAPSAPLVARAGAPAAAAPAPPKAAAAPRASGEGEGNLGLFGVLAGLVLLATAGAIVYLLRR